MNNFNSDVYVANALRTPVGKYGGALSSIRPDDLAALTIRAVVEESGIPAQAVDEVIFGNANGAGEENRNVARMAWLLNGYPDSVPGMTVNRLCASGMSAISIATALIRSGEADIVIAGGVESMSRAPWVIEKPKDAFSKPGEVFDTSIGWRFINRKFEQRDKMTYSMPETAEEVARVRSITREECDEFAYLSHMKAYAATQRGLFESELIPVSVPQKKNNETNIVRADESIRPNTTKQILSNLRSVVPGGTVVTAGNSSSLNDGASAVVICSETAIKKYGLTPRARIVGTASAGISPEIMGLGPVPATKKLLERIGWTTAQLEAVELNEAFASQSIACIRELEIDSDIVNSWGGAIALGHPLGSSGCRIVTTLLNRMEKEGAKRGIATMCVGVGQGQSLALAI